MAVSYGAFLGANMHDERRVTADNRIGVLEILVARLEEKLVASEKSVGVTQLAFDEFKKSSNEWRAALNDQRALFVTFDGYEAKHAPLELRVTNLESTRNVDSGKSVGVEHFWSVINTVLILILGGLAVFYKR